MLRPEESHSRLSSREGDQIGDLLAERVDDAELLAPLQQEGRTGLRLQAAARA